jgi:putative RNA 2'-phosphotransferase
MTDKERNSISKFLSLVLRHKPEQIGLLLDKEGWVDVQDLLSKADISFVDLQEIVTLNDKKRFIFSDDFSKIRANQGHSINVELNLQPITPPEILYHGTAEKNIASILEKGILKQSRNHVHLSDSIETAKNVGKRYGKPVVLEVLALEMNSAGHEFYLSENNIWLTEHVSTIYIRKHS